MANMGSQAMNKPASGKHGNVLPLWGNEKTMNLNPMILTNVLSSPYFKVQLYELKTYHEVVDEIYFKVTHVEPWEKGSRKTAGQTGMCGGVRGVGTGGIVSTAFCLLYKLFTLKLTRKQLMGLITHTDSPYIRALGFMYIRYTQPPADLIDWYDDFMDDEEVCHAWCATRPPLLFCILPNCNIHISQEFLILNNWLIPLFFSLDAHCAAGELDSVSQHCWFACELDVKAGGGCVMTVGEMLRSFLTKLEWFSTLFPRIPVPVQKSIDQQMKSRPRKVPQKEPQEEDEAFEEPGRQGERRRSRSPRRTPTPRRSPKRSRSRSHHRERDRHGPSYDRELERERERQRKERDARERDRERAERERRRSRSAERNHQERRERRRSRSGSRDKRSERKEKERDGGDDRSKRKERDHHRERPAERDRSRERKSKGENDEKRHKEDRERHREERKAKRSSRSRSRERRHKSGGGEEKSRKSDSSHSREKERDGEQRPHKRSRSRERSHHPRETSNDHSKHGDKRRSPSVE
ncbi:pre-mRNA-splicing factor 38B isoform X1 [Syngnathus scovelli]|uniref:pre-mRNA-splicing factor 38B isoform X1 n=1 Tax=Syngnathus scovelli TaxID=161590 RepID=UPI002110B8DC|nr:pre-mRNA-splicing factor 38B isoform X1 [Syngnathus scovelli]